MKQIKAIETRYKGYRFRSRLEARWAVFFDAMDIPYQYEPEGYDLGSLGWYLPDFLLWPESAPVWFEVKGKKATADEFMKMSALCNATGIGGFISSGTMDTPETEKGRKGKIKITGAIIHGITPKSGWVKSNDNTFTAEAKNFDESMICGFYEDKDGSVFLDHLYVLDTDKFPSVNEVGIYGEDGSAISRLTDALKSIEHSEHVDVRWILKIDKSLNTYPGYNVGGGRWYRSKALKAAYQKARSARFEHGEQG